jgi:hypothetical protein
MNFVLIFLLNLDEKRGKTTPSVFLHRTGNFLLRKGINSLKNNTLSFVFKKQKKTLFENQKHPILAA